MDDIGGFALRFALLGALYAAIVALLGVRLGRRELIQSAERAAYTVFGVPLLTEGSSLAIWRSDRRTRP